jgi:hypothetical protein
MPWVHWDSNKLAREMEVEINAASTSATNFAGHYLAVEAKCGENCQKHAFINIPDGNIASYGLTSATGIRFQSNSRLLIVNPTPLPNKPTLYYDFTGNLNYICEKKS